MASLSLWVSKSCKDPACPNLISVQVTVSKQTLRPYRPRWAACIQHLAVPVTKTNSQFTVHPRCPCERGLRKQTLGLCTDELWFFYLLNHTCILGIMFLNLLNNISFLVLWKDTSAVCLLYFTSLTASWSPHVATNVLSGM